MQGLGQFDAVVVAAASIVHADAAGRARFDAPGALICSSGVVWYDYKGGASCHMVADALAAGRAQSERVLTCKCCKLRASCADL